MGSMVSKPVREAAKSEACTLQIAGVCNYNWDTTVFAHLPDESKGMGTKADDLSGCFACHACHDAIDGRRKNALHKHERDFYMRRAQTRTLRRLFEKGLLQIKGMAQ